MHARFAGGGRVHVVAEVHFDQTEVVEVAKDVVVKELGVPVEQFGEFRFPVIERREIPRECCRPSKGSCTELRLPKFILESSYSFPFQTTKVIHLLYCRTIC